MRDSSCDPTRSALQAGRRTLNGIGAVWRDLLVLLAIFAVCMAIAVRFFKWDATPR